jgi:hypothetical protein
MVTAARHEFRALAAGWSTLLAEFLNQIQSDIPICDAAARRSFKGHQYIQLEFHVLPTYLIGAVSGLLGNLLIRRPVCAFFLSCVFAGGMALIADALVGRAPSMRDSIAFRAWSSHLVVNTLSATWPVIAVIGFAAVVQRRTRDRARGEH